MMFVEPREVVNRGLRYLKLDPKRKWNKNQRAAKYKKHYGANALNHGTQWYDMCNTDIEGARLTKKEVDQGFKMFLAAHYFLWQYNKNADVLGDNFGICVRYARGSHIWNWIEHIAALEKKVIFWPKELDRNDTEINAISIDGCDKKTWEVQHESLPYDKASFSVKHNNGGLKYQIVLSAHRQQCVHIFGPMRGGMGDKEMLSRSGIVKRLKKGKLANVDRGYIDKKWKHSLSWPNPQQDNKETNNLKSRIRLRHESFNGKMAKYGSMYQTWHHTTKQHGLAFRAVAVTVQYSMNNGDNILYDA
jgi:hypothetical protein